MKPGEINKPAGKWDLSRLGKCPIHGHHAGKECPLCDGGVIPAAECLPPPTNVDRSKWWSGPEKKLHDLFALEMIRLDVRFIHARTDQKSTIAKGWPDFTCMKRGEDSVSRVCMVELKNRAGRTSRDQDECIADLTAAGLPVLVTGDFREASEFVREWLGIPES
jgi:hypothetical protein